MKVCGYCERPLKNREVVIVDNDEYICSDCYEEYTITFYRVGGEYFGDENDTELDFYEGDNYQQIKMNEVED